MADPNVTDTTHQQWAWVTFPVRMLEFPGIPDATVGVGIVQPGYLCRNKLTGDLYIQKSLDPNVPDWRGIITT